MTNEEFKEAVLVKATEIAKKLHADGYHANLDPPSLEELKEIPGMCRVLQELALWAKGVGREENNSN